MVDSSTQSWSFGLLEKQEKIKQHLMKRQGESKCDEGYSSQPLNPSKICKDKFTLKRISDNVILQHGHKNYNPDQFCLLFHEDGILGAELCIKEKSKTRFEWVSS